METVVYLTVYMTLVGLICFFLPIAIWCFIGWLWSEIERIAEGKREKKYAEINGEDAVHDHTGVVEARS